MRDQIMSLRVPAPKPPATPPASALTRTVNALRRERDLVRTLKQQWMDTIDAVAHPIMLHDRDFRIVRANRAYAERAGMSFPQMIGRPYWECFPKCGGPLPECRKLILQEGFGVQAQFIEEEVLLDTGEIFTSRAFAVSDARGRFVHTLHLFEDATERRRADGHARALLEVTTSEVILQGDIQAVARQITEAAAAATGVARANVWLFNEAEDELHCIDLYEARSGSHSSGAVLREKEFGNEFAALKHAPYVDASEPLTDPRTRGYVESYLKPLGITSMLDTVVELSGRHIGLLCLEHVGKPHVWRSDEIAFAARLADKIAAALSNRITRRAEGALRTSEERLILATQSAHIGIWDWDIVANRLVWDARMYELYGIREQDFSGAFEAWQRGLHPEDRARGDAEVAAALDGTRDFHTEFRVVWPGGEVRDIEGHAVVMRAQDGTTTRMIGVNWDVTNRRAAERALRESEEKFRAIFDHTQDGILVMNIDPPSVMYANNAMERLLGYHTGELAGMSMSELHPQDAVRQATHAFTQAAQDIANAVQDLPMRAKDDRVVYVDVTGATVALGGRRYLLGAFRDATERRAAEATLRTQLEELRRWQAINLGREDRVLDLKREVNELLKQSRQPPRYASAQ